MFLNLENPFKSAKSGLLEISWNQKGEASPSSFQVRASPPKTPEQQISDYKKGFAHLLNNGGVFRRGRTGSGEKQPSSRRSAGKERPWGDPGVNFVLSPGSAGKRKERRIRVLRLMTDTRARDSTSQMSEDIARRHDTQISKLEDQQFWNAQSKNNILTRKEMESFQQLMNLQNRAQRHSENGKSQDLWEKSAITRVKGVRFNRQMDTQTEQTEETPKNNANPLHVSKKKIKYFKTQTSIKAIDPPSESKGFVTNFQEKRAKWKAFRSRRTNSKRKLLLPSPFKLKNLPEQMTDFSSFGGVPNDQNFQSSREQKEIKLDENFEGLAALNLLGPMTPSQRPSNREKQSRRRRRSKQIGRPIAQFELGFETFEAVQGEQKTETVRRQSHDWQKGARRFVRKYGVKSPKVIKNNVLEEMFATPRNIHDLQVSKMEILSAEQKLQGSEVVKKRRKRGAPIVSKFAKFVDVEISLNQALDSTPDFKKSKPNFDKKAIDFELMKRERKYTGENQKKLSKDQNGMRSQTIFRKLPKLPTINSVKKTSSPSEADETRPWSF